MVCQCCNNDAKNFISCIQYHAWWCNNFESEEGSVEMLLIVGTVRLGRTRGSFFHSRKALDWRAASTVCPGCPIFASLSLAVWTAPLKSANIEFIYVSRLVSHTARLNVWQFTRVSSLFFTALSSSSQASMAASSSLS